MKEIAIAAAREAGKLMLDWRKQMPPGPTEMKYKNGKDIITPVDVQAQKIIRELIHKNYPDHNIVDEEDEESESEKVTTSNSPFTWYVDPLDGSANYAADLAASCVSIALVEDDQLIIGVVYDPFREELFVAERGKGATLNGQPIRVSQTAKLEDALVCFEVGYDTEEASRQLKEVVFFHPRVRGMRIPGSSALALVNVAVGRYDLFYFQPLESWDLAAGLLIVQEAGGVTTDRNGDPAHYSKPSIIAATPKIHTAFMQVFAEYRRKTGEV